jgi:hypothetical protein
MRTETRIAVIGDPHVAVPQGEDDARLEVDPGRKLHGLSVELLTATIAEINREADIDAVLIMGDMTRDGELFNHEKAREVLSGIAAPYYIVTGNHDLKRERKPGVEYPGARRLDLEEFAVFYRDTGLPGGNTRYRVDLPGNTALVVLDSNRTLHEMAANSVDLSRQDDGRIGDDQLAWLDATLDSVERDGRFPLVACHHSIADHSPAGGATAAVRLPLAGRGYADVRGFCAGTTSRWCSPATCMRRVWESRTESPIWLLQLRSAIRIAGANSRSGRIPLTSSRGRCMASPPVLTCSPSPGPGWRKGWGE